MKRVIFLFLFLLSTAIAFIYLSSPVNSGQDNKVFVVNQGDGLSDIAKRLESNGFIRNQYIFIFHSYFSGLRQKLQAGSFSLSPSDSTPQIVQKLTEAKRAEYWLKIIDGQRVDEINQKLGSAYFPKSEEGHIFPDSYLIPMEYSPAQILDLIETNFNKKVAQAKVGVTDTALTDNEILTLASLIEREARTLESKQMVSGILRNRLEISMALQVDASVQFARDSIKKPSDYWQPVSKSDLEIISPYNTYKNPGLPPSPICNPGYNSIYAAYHPIPSDYLYYITGNDNQMHYSKTYDEHMANIAKYLK